MFCCLLRRGEELDAQPLFYNDATPFTVESLTGLWSDLKATVDALSEVRPLEEQHPCNLLLVVFVTQSIGGQLRHCLPVIHCMLAWPGAAGLETSNLLSLLNCTVCSHTQLLCI